jgi:hypothetical protein
MNKISSPLSKAVRQKVWYGPAFASQRKPALGGQQKAISSNLLTQICFLMIVDFTIVID